jgi:hypothetical protein
MFYERNGNIRSLEDRKGFYFPDEVKAKQLKNPFGPAKNARNPDYKMEYTPYSLEKGKWKIIMMATGGPRKLVSKQFEFLGAIERFLDVNNLREQFDIQFIRLDPISPQEENVWWAAPTLSIWKYYDKYVTLSAPNNDLRYFTSWIAHENMSDLPIVRNKLNTGEDVPLKLPVIYLLNPNNEILADIAAFRHDYDYTKDSKYRYLDPKGRLHRGVLSKSTLAFNIIKALDLDFEESMNAWYESLAPCQSGTQYYLKIDVPGDCMNFELERWLFHDLEFTGRMKMNEIAEETVQEITEGFLKARDSTLNKK